MKPSLNRNAVQSWMVGFVAVAIAAAANADVLYSQPPSTSGSVLQSAYWDPDGSNYDEYVWDGFLLPVAGNVNEIRWRGAYPGGGAGGGNITDFEVAIFASIPAGTQPDLGYQYPGPLVHYMTGDNAGETYAGNVGGTNMYDYHLVLPRPFAAAANTRYWVQIIAWQPGWPTWGLATGTGGNGSHFGRVPAVTGDYRFITAGSDAAFSLIGTSVGCIPASITVHPAPASLCAAGGTASFSVVAGGSAPLAYSWRKDGVAISEGATTTGAVISGSGTATLTVSGVMGGDSGTYSCIVSNSCGNAPTLPATLSLCMADVNCSGAVTVQDIFDFLAFYFGGDPRGDYNGSGAVSVQDIFDFLGAYFGGCV